MVTVVTNELESQFLLELDKLYKINVSNTQVKNVQYTPNLEFLGGRIDVYISQIKPTTIADMQLDDDNSSLQGVNIFNDFVPSYIAFKQHSGTTTRIISTGINVIDLGAI